MLELAMTHSVPPRPMGIHSIPLGSVEIRSSSTGPQRFKVSLWSAGADAESPLHRVPRGVPISPSLGDPGVNGDSAKNKQIQ